MGSPGISRAGRRRIGSLAEIVEDGVTGLLVTPGDHAALAERMRWAVDHPREMFQLGVNARQRYETRYRGAAYLAALLDTYHALPEGKRQVAGALVLWVGSSST